jgi:hypothetical protein
MGRNTADFSTGQNKAPGIVSENYGTKLTDRVLAKTPFGNAKERVARVQNENRSNNNRIISENKRAASNPRPKPSI